VLACSPKQEQMNTVEQAKPLPLERGGTLDEVGIYLGGDGASFSTARLSPSVQRKNRQ
jgi:hypothetical protein